jgi:hypothetical protein
MLRHSKVAALFRVAERQGVRCLAVSFIHDLVIGVVIDALRGLGKGNERVVEVSGRWGPYRQVSPPPARHHPGARSGRLGDVSLFYRRPDGEVTCNVSVLQASLAQAVVAAVGLGGPVSAGEPLTLNGRLEGDVTRTAEPLLVLVGVDATGNAPHRGQFTLDNPN